MCQSSVISSHKELLITSKGSRLDEEFIIHLHFQRLGGSPLVVLLLFVGFILFILLLDTALLSGLFGRALHFWLAGSIGVD